MILVGAEDGATLGTLWMASESRRYRLIQNPQFPAVPKLSAKPEGKDVVACVWLNLSNSIGPERARTNVAPVLPLWLQDAGKAQKVPMAFFFGKEDAASAADAQRWVGLLRNRGEPRETFARPVSGAKLRGSPLLKVKDDDNTIAQLLADYLGTKIVDKFGSNEVERSSKRCMTGCMFTSIGYPERPIWQRPCVTRSVTADIPGKRYNAIVRIDSHLLVRDAAIGVDFVLNIGSNLRIRPRADGSRVDVRSASRIGTHDLGQNARRIRAYLEEISNLALALK